MIFCKKCILPNTRPNLKISIDGICNACIDNENKSKINWHNRKKKLLEIIRPIKKINTNYHCLIPVSGGKDSTWQVVECLKLGLKPLTISWKTPGRNTLGQKNLNNLLSLGVDHIDYTINPIVESKFMLEAFKKFGATAIPMHMALFNIPINIADKLNIPLIVYGENSAQEYGGDAKHTNSYNLSKSWLKKYGVTQGTEAKDWVSKKLTKLDLIAYKSPNWKSLENKGIKAIFLGHFLKWDINKSYLTAKKNGFLARKEGPKVGIYNFTDIDCDFISIHHWLKWFKFGFTRDMDNLSIEIRNKRISRDKALKILKKKGLNTPRDDIKKFCKFVGISLKEFDKICEKFRNKNIWKKDEKGNWNLKNFII
tara:strand:+ start:1740 stop:2843 length:1104 start_codon:yes stop_codon:yes gene_type:complete